MKVKLLEHQEKERSAQGLSLVKEPDAHSVICDGSERIGTQPQEDVVQSGRM